MKKFTKKLLAIVLSLVMVIPFAACGEVIDDDIPEDRVQIKISMYVGGFGSEWMDNLIAHLNEEQETYYYTRNEDNKMASNEITGKILGGVIEADIYSTTPADVERIANGQYLEDLSEVFEYTPDGETLKIKDKMYGYEDYSKNFSDANGIYVMPNQYGASSMIYDHDLFELNGWLATDSSTSNGLTKGADGKEGTYDDGLPVTYDEFKALVEQISIDQKIPFVYGDAIGFGQLKPAVESMWAQYEGIESFNAAAGYSGTYTSPTTGVKTQITPQTGYKVYSENLMEGRWKATQFIDELLLNGDYLYDEDSGLSHTDAQSKFIMSHNKTDIAMLFDGTWWENEAKRAFLEDAKNNTEEEYGYGKRDFRLMPMPMFDGQVEESNGKHYFYGGADGSIFAVKQSDETKRQGVIEFFKAYVSDWNCRNYIKSTGGTLPFKYELPAEERNALSPFSKNTLEVLYSESTVLVMPYWKEKACDLNTVPNRWGNVTVNGVGYGTHWTAMNDDSVTIESYKNGVLNSTYTEANWGDKTK